MTDEKTYRRGQVEWALWRFYALYSFAMPKAMPKAFATRIKRLLELDRAGAGLRESEAPGAAFAFMDAEPQGQGSDVEYSPFNAFCLALGLDMLDAGFKQSEVVFLLRHIRPALEEAFERILQSPPDLLGRRIAADRRPGCPSYEEKGRRRADCRVYAVIQRVETTEAYPIVAEKLPKGMPIIPEPVFCRGVEALREELHRRGPGHRTALVIEIAHAAAGVTHLLTEAPLVKRGRR